MQGHRDRQASRYFALYFLPTLGFAACLARFAEGGALSESPSLSVSSPVMSLSASSRFLCLDLIIDNCPAACSVECASSARLPVRFIVNYASGHAF